MSNLLSEISQKLRDKGLKLVTAESCTGGLIAANFTDLAGSSDIFERGFVTYSNQSKVDLLGVFPETLEQYGAVSEQTAKEMVEGALKNSQADWAISVTGIAGPGGGSNEKPVGLVYIGVSNNNGCEVTKNMFNGDRQAIRAQTVEHALRYLMKALEGE